MPLKITYEEFCRRLQLDPEAEALVATLPDFAFSAATLPGMPHFMQREYYEKYCLWIGADSAELLPWMDQVSALTAADRMLQLYAWHAYNVLFIFRTQSHTFSSWPAAESKLGKLTGIFDLMIAMSAIELYEANYRKLGLPEHFARDAAKWLGGTIEIHRASHQGFPGICRSQVYWLRHYIETRLFRIGRFEFMTEPLNTETARLFRHKDTGEIVALCNDGWALTREGYRLRWDEPPENAVATTRYRNDGKIAVGTLIDPHGFALPGRETTLDLNVFEPAFRPHDIVPGVHIPAGGHMTLEAARESFKQAVDFYRRYLHLNVPAFCCFSWIFNTAFERELPGSNLAKLMRQLYLFPCPGGSRDGLFFAFGRSDGDPATYQRDTSLRCAFHRILEAGESLRSGGMVLLTADLDAFGTEFYRLNFARFHGNQS